jgi:hypothetical protein
VTRIYTHPGIPGRPTLSIVVVVLAALYGIFEVVHGWWRDTPDTTGIVFGLFFIGGGLYGFQKTWTEARDVVLSLDMDEAARQAVITLWRPFRPLVIRAGLDALTGWRHYIQVGQRDSRTHLLLCDCAGYPRPLRFDFPRGQPIPDGLRRIAPEAVSDFEANAGSPPGPAA